MLNVLVLLWPLFGGCKSEAMVAERLYDAGDDSGALNLLERIRSIQPDCSEADWRLAYVRLAEANREQDAAKRLLLWKAGSESAERCVATFPNSGGAWFVSALALGVETGFVGARRRVELSSQVRERVGRSLALDPSLAGSWYLLAKWHESLCSLNFIERGFANLLLGGLPQGASLDSAREYLKKSNALRPDSPVVLLDLAKILDQAGGRSEALAICRHASSLPRLAHGDRKNLDELAKLRQKLESSGS